MNKHEVNTIELEELQSNIERVFNLLLSGEKWMGNSITGIKINSGEITLFKNNSFKKDDKVISYIEANQDDINMEHAEKFLDTIPKVHLIGSKEKKNRKLIVANLERLNLTDQQLDEDFQFQGLNFLYSKVVLYVDDSEEALKDPRPLREKMAELQVNGMRNFAAFKLIESEAQKGIYMDYDKITYKVGSGGTNEYLGQLPTEVEGTNYLKVLDFENLGFPIKEINYSTKTLFINIPSMHKMSLNEDLKSALNKTTGIVILDSLNAYDLINSSILDDQKDRQVWYSGTKLPSKSRKIKITPSNDYPNVTDKTVNILKDANYSWIIDDMNILTAEQIIELADDNLVIVGGNLKDIKVYFSKLDIIGKEKYKLFVNRCIYIGSIYNNSGKYLNDMDKDIIINKDFGLLGNILKENIKLEDLILKVYTKISNCKEINIKNRKVFVTINENGKESVSRLKEIDVDNNDILQMVLRNEQNKSKSNINYSEVLESLNNDNSYTSIITKEDEVNKGFTKNLKVNVFRSGNEILVRTRPLISPESVVNFDINFNKGASILLFGGRETGKTTTIKSLLYKLAPKHKVYIYDPDYDITSKEYAMTENTIIDRKNLRIDLLKPYDPDIVVINSDINAKDYMDILMTVSDKTILLVASSFNIIDDILTRKDIYFDNYKIESLLSRSLVYDLVNKTEIKPSFNTQYFKDRLNPYYKELNFDKIYKDDRKIYYNI